MVVKAATAATAEAEAEARRRRRRGRGEAEAGARAEADLRVIRQPVAPLGLQGLLVSSAPRLCQLVGVVAILRTHRRHVSDAADPPRREQCRRTGVQAGGASQAKH